MKVLISLLFVCLLIVSCGPSKEEIERLRKEKSIRVADSLKIVKAARIELSKIAYGDAKFGMSKNELLKTSVFKDGLQLGNHIEAKFEYSQIGKYNYYIKAYFNGYDSLYHVSIETEYKSADFIDTEVLDRVKNLRDVIQINYGKPTTNFRIPNLSDYKPGKIQWIYKWVYEDKLIAIGIEEVNIGSKYHCHCMIYDKPMNDRIRRQKNS